MNAAPALPLFGAVGVELEYMIVDRQTLSVLPCSDELLRSVAGRYESEVELGELAWSNEVVLHVVELKTNGPRASLAGLSELFARDVERINRLLEPLGGRLMPTAMHPWMKPLVETKIWPHDYRAVYEAFDRIFGVRGHGWSNLQSVHLNLPFADDLEFARLHAAVRLLLPLMPALAASSPIVEGKSTGLADNRLEAYRHNARRIPSITGAVVPEAVFSRSEYEEKILAPMYSDIAPFDPEGILRYEWLNARGAIARFDRNTIEIRVLDMQECPQADLAVAAAVIVVLEAMTKERWIDLETQKAWPTERLAAIFLATIARAGSAVIEDSEFLAAYGWREARAPSAAELWRHLVAEVTPQNAPTDTAWRAPLDLILQQGTLAQRIVRALGERFSAEDLHRVYGELCRCLALNHSFSLRTEPAGEEVEATNSGS